MLKLSQIRKLAKPYSDTHICHTNYHQIISTAGWWGSPWMLFFELTPVGFDFQLPVPQGVIDLLGDIHTAPTTQIWPVSLVHLPDIGYSGDLLLKFENAHTDLEAWIDARYFSTILRKANSHHQALTFHVIERPPHDNGNTKNIFVARILGSPIALVACITLITDNWTWRLINNDTPRPRHHIPRPIEVNLEMASQPALM
jgi:hypothetical protein